MPDSRKDLMLDMRSREEADGETRMIGSGRREDFLSREAREVDGMLVAGMGLLRSREKASAYFRT